MRPFAARSLPDVQRIFREKDSNHQPTAYEGRCSTLELSRNWAVALPPELTQHQVLRVVAGLEPTSPAYWRPGEVLHPCFSPFR